MTKKKCFCLLTVLVFSAFISSAQRVVVKSNPTMNDRFSKRAGSLRLSSTILKMGKVTNKETKSDTLRIFNDSSRPLTLETGNVPPHLFITLGTPHLAPKAETWIAVTYHAEKRKDYGFVLDRFQLVTNDSVHPKKMISVSAMILEYFAPMSAADSVIAPKAKWPMTYHDYGKLRQGFEFTHNFTLHNEGKQDLYIRKIQLNCVCLKAEAAADTIAPGTTTTITVEFDTTNKLGKDSRKMNVYLNDPFQPEVVLELKGEIEK